MNSQIFKIVSTGVGAMFIFVATTPALAQMPPLSPSQMRELNNFRRNYGESSFLIQRNEPLENPSEGFELKKTILQDSTTPPIAQPIVEVSEPEFQAICRQNRQAVNFVRTPDGNSFLVGCED
ncbi:MAG: hypothetical protein HC820_08555 [Hydrococcus sp. RM1_1_31]|nr:hypothetical protein [Hydrococcus sp. RM1_1_31]